MRFLIVILTLPVFAGATSTVHPAAKVVSDVIESFRAGNLKRVEALSMNWSKSDSQFFQESSAVCPQLKYKVLNVQTADPAQSWVQIKKGTMLVTTRVTTVDMHAVAYRDMMSMLADGKSVPEYETPNINKNRQRILRACKEGKDLTTRNVQTFAMKTGNVWKVVDADILVGTLSGQNFQPWGQTQR